MLNKSSGIYCVGAQSVATVTAAVQSAVCLAQQRSPVFSYFLTIVAVGYPEAFGCV